MLGTLVVIYLLARKKERNWEERRRREEEREKEDKRSLKMGQEREKESWAGQVERLEGERE